MLLRRERDRGGLSSVIARPSRTIGGALWREALAGCEELDAAALDPGAEGNKP